MKKMLILLVMILGVLEFSFSAPIQPLNRIVAIVNKDVITQNAVDNGMTMIKKQIQAANQTLPPDSKLRQQILNQLIDQKLALQTAVKEKITITDAQLNTAIASVAAQNHLTVAQLQQQVEKQGMNYATYKKQVRKQLLLNAVERQAVGSTIKVSNAEVAAAMKKASAQANIPEYHLQALLVPVPTSPTLAQIQTAQNEANKLIQKLHKGARFSTLAILESSATESLQGGDMGFRQLNQLPVPIATKLAGAVAGSIVGPINTANGFYILKVVAIRQSTISKANLENQIRQILYYQKFQQAVKKWAAQLRTTAYIKILNS